jgi:hypothetical protein
LSKLEYLGKVLLDTRQPEESAVNAFIALKPDRSKYMPHEGSKQALKAKARMIANLQSIPKEISRPFESVFSPYTMGRVERFTAEALTIVDGSEWLA